MGFTTYFDSYSLPACGQTKYRLLKNPLTMFKEKYGMASCKTGIYRKKGWKCAGRLDRTCSTHSSHSACFGFKPCPGYTYEGLSYLSQNLQTKSNLSQDSFLPTTYPIYCSRTIRQYSVWDADSSINLYIYIYNIRDGLWLWTLCHCHVFPWKRAVFSNVANTHDSSTYVRTCAVIWSIMMYLNALFFW